MNKEEIEDTKEDLRTLHKVLWNEHREGTYTIQRILEYINCLEQKESILDKVTDKLKEMNSKYTKEYKNVENLYLIEQDVSILQELSCVLDDVEEILNIIEEEREYCCTCGVELNSENKALNNMCNECKYGLDYQKEREEK